MIELAIEQRRRDLGDGFRCAALLPSAAAPHGGTVHLLRPHGAGRFCAPESPRGRRASASPYRAGDGHLPVRRRDHASRQPGLGAADPPRRSQLDDGRPRHHPLRALRARARRRASRSHGIQAWVALPEEAEESSPPSATTAPSSAPYTSEGGAVGAPHRRRGLRRESAGARRIRRCSTSIGELQPRGQRALPTSYPRARRLHRRPAASRSTGGATTPDSMLVFRAGRAGRRSRARRRAVAHAAGRRAGRRALHRVEFRLLLAGAHRAGEGGLARGTHEAAAARRSGFIPLPPDPAPRNA